MFTAEYSLFAAYNYLLAAYNMSDLFTTNYLLHTFICLLLIIFFGCLILFLKYLHRCLLIHYGC